jgi:hypothetical protein
MPYNSADNYDSGDSETDSKSSKSMGKEQDDEGAEALLPKSILMGKEFNVGDEVVLKITHMYEDEISVVYAKEKKDKGEDSDYAHDKDSSDMSKAMEDMDSMTA